MKEISEMDAAELGDVLWNVLDRFIALHKAFPEHSHERVALWEARYRVQTAAEKVGEALAEGGFK